MPVYNAGKYLAAAIDSILAQTFTDFEFLIIDDASTDSSVSIVQAYTDSRIRLYQNKENLGISATLNKGIALASCEVIARMDADDISYPERLEKQYGYLLAHPECTLVCAKARVVTEDGQLIRVDRFGSALYYYNLTFICWIYHATVMFRKGAVQEVGGYSTTYGEDYALWCQLLRKYKIHNLPEVLLDYRESEQSISNVLKREEYEQAGREQTLRNLRYFAGEKYTLPESCLECLRHNFTPLLEEQNVGNILSCLRELDYITKCILQKPNINRDQQAIRLAAKYKRRFILSFFARNLPRHKGILLLLRDHAFLYLLDIAISQFKRKRKKRTNETEGSPVGMVPEQAISKV